MKTVLRIFGLMLILSGLSAFGRETRVFQRSDENLRDCISRYQRALGIKSSIEADRACANYTDQNLDCALSVMREYGVTQHRAAIEVCIMRYSNATARRCAINMMENARQIGERVDLPTYLKKCKNGVLSVAPLEIAPAPVPPANTDQFVPSYPSPPSDSPDSYGWNPLLLGKIQSRIFKSAVANWLHTDAEQISNIKITSYFSWINQVLETIAIQLGRSARLYTVQFGMGAKSIECTGTDFGATLPKNATYRYFTLHECTVDGQPLARQFGDLDYGFINGLTPEFRTRMQAMSHSSGPGNISFQRNASEYLIISY